MHISHMRNECYVYIVSPQIMGTVNDSNTDDQYTVANVFESLGNSFDGSRKQMYSDILWTLFLFLSWKCMLSVLLEPRHRYFVENKKKKKKS